MAQSRLPSGYVDNLHQTFFKEFTQNKYQFKEQVINKLHVKDRIIFASQVGDLLLLSESSLGWRMRCALTWG
ncbi:MAG: hypothetical protein U5K69_05095 [Balneolaceae bacterium]|nr:hypothetical protein [Balneolaceae bacterium]